MSEANIKNVVATYVKIRDTLDEERKKFKAVEVDLKGQMERLSMWLRDRADDLGVDSFKTQDGTAYRVVKESYRVGNWDDVIDFIKKTLNFQMLEKRIGKLATQEIHKESGKIPPGVDYNVEVEFQVRKPSKR